MKFNINSLRSASKYTTLSIESINESFRYSSSKGKVAFLCHSHRDRDLIVGLQQKLKENGINLYVDWQDSNMPEKTNRITAEKLQQKIKEADYFLFLATKNSKESRWCPWEIGYADSVKNRSKILIIPTEGDSDAWDGNEYLQLYEEIDKSSFNNSYQSLW